MVLKVKSKNHKRGFMCKVGEVKLFLCFSIGPNFSHPILLEKPKEKSGIMNGLLHQQEKYQILCPEKSVFEIFLIIIKFFFIRKS